MMWLELLSVLFFGVAMAGYPCCCGPKCHCCTDATAPSAAKRTYVVTFTGVTNGSCGTCDDWNDTAWIVDSFIETGAFRCKWELDAGLPCSFDMLEFRFDCEGPGTGLELYSATCLTYKFSDGGTDGAFVLATNPTPTDCSDPGLLPYLGAISNNTQCDWSAATCDVS